MDHDSLIGTPGHTIRAQDLSNDEHGICTLYVCSCGLSRTIERLPQGSYLKSEWYRVDSER
jgi:hypothetical protein